MNEIEELDGVQLCDNTPMEAEIVRAEIKAIIVPAIAERDALRKALLDVEWVSLRDSWLRCPWCGRKKSEGHAENCMRQMAIGGSDDLVV